MRQGAPMTPGARLLGLVALRLGLVPLCPVCRLPSAGAAVCRACLRHRLAEVWAWVEAAP